MATVRLLAIFVLLALCACSIAPPARPSPPESSPLPSPPASPSSSITPITLPLPYPKPSLPGYVEPVYPDLSHWNMRVLAQHEYEGVSVTQFHYFFDLDGEQYEGTNISAIKDVYWSNEWKLEYIGSGDGLYDSFHPFVSDRDRIYLLHGGSVNARDVATGKEIWNLTLTGGPHDGAVDSNGNLYVSCTESPFMTAISPAGEILWQVVHVNDYGQPYNVRIVGKEIIISMFAENDDHDVHFDFGGNYRVVKR